MHVYSRLLVVHIYGRLNLAVLNHAPGVGPSIRFVTYRCTIDVIQCRSFLKTNLRRVTSTAPLHALITRKWTLFAGHRAHRPTVSKVSKTWIYIAHNISVVLLVPAIICPLFPFCQYTYIHIYLSKTAALMVWMSATLMLNISKSKRFRRSCPIGSL